MALAVGAAQPTTPTTVNGHELGAIEEFETRGPARLCMNSVTIDLVEGEVGYLQYAGIHEGRLMVLTQKSSYEISLGSGAGFRFTDKDPFLVGKKWEIWRSGAMRKPKLLIRYDTEDQHDWHEAAVVAALEPASWTAHLDFIRRIFMSPSEPADCDRRYTYGWDMLLGERPLSEKNTGEPNGRENVREGNDLGREETHDAE